MGRGVSVKGASIIQLDGDELVIFRSGVSNATINRRAAGDPTGGGEGGAQRGTICRPQSEKPFL